MEMIFQKVIQPENSTPTCKHELGLAVILVEEDGEGGGEGGVGQEGDWHAETSQFIYDIHES